MKRLWHRFRRLSRTLRFRVTVAATLVVGIVFGVGSVALIGLQARLLDADIDLALGEDLDVVSAALLSGVPAADAVDRADPAAAITVRRDEIVIADREAQSNSHRGGGRPDEFRTSSRELPVDGDVVTITARRSRRSVERTTGRAAVAAFGVIPVLTIVIGFVIWRVVGHTLRPVEAIRAEAATVASTAAGQRLPVPPTGDEIERLATTLNGMLDRLAQSSRRQQQLVADAAHELRSPLAGIHARLEVDDRYGDASQWPTTRSQVLEQVTRLQRIVDALLLLSRHDAGLLKPAQALVDLDDVVAEAVLATAGSRAGVDVDTHLRPAQVRGDLDLLGQVVINLLDNGLRHANSIVSVSVTEAGATVELAVTDDGDGVPADARDRVFERFVRLDQARSRDSGGAGLGLAISRDLVELHGGTLTLDPTQLNGARFVVRLPAAS